MPAGSFFLTDGKNTTTFRRMTGPAERKRLFLLKIANPLRRALILILLSRSFLLGAQPAEGPAQLLAQARNALDSGYFQRAACLAEDVLALEPGAAARAEIYYLQGSIALENGALRSAAAAFQRTHELAESLSPANEAARPLRALALSGMGRYYFALHDIDKALALHQAALDLRRAHYGPRRPEVADSYNNLANCYQLAGYYPKALTLYHQVLSIRQEFFPDDHPKIAAAFNNLGALYLVRGQAREALQHFERTLSIRRAAFGENHLLTARIRQNIGNAYAALHLPDSAIRHFHRALAVYQENLPPDHPRLADINENLGNAYTARRAFGKSLAHHRAALATRQRQLPTQPAALARSYENLGDLFLEQGDYAAAETHLRRALALNEQAYGERHETVAIVADKLGLTLRYLGRYDEAVSRHRRALGIREAQFGSRHPFVAGICNNIGNCYRRLGDYSAAIDYYERSLEILRTAGPDHHLERTRVLTNIGNCYLETGKTEKAIACFRQAEGILPEKQAVARAELYQNLGEALSRQNEFASAENYFTQALQLLDYHPERSPFDQTAPLQIIGLLGGAGGNALRQYEATHQAPFLDEAFERFRAAMTGMDSLQRTFLSPQSRQKLKEAYFPVVEGALETTYLRGLLYQEPSLLEAAFYLSEQNKSTLLLESVRTQQAAALAAIPERQQRRYRSLAKAINQAEKLLDAPGPKTGEEFRDLEKQLFTWRQEREKLEKTIEREYPDFRRLRFDQSPATITAIRNQVLEADQTLLSFFTGSRAIYAFLISRDTFRAHRLDRRFPLERWVAELGRSIVAFPKAGLARQAALDSAYRKGAHQLYRQLLTPLFAGDHLPKRLIIVPDGALGALPFDALLTEPPAKPLRYRSYPFLLKKTIISYAYSATLLHERRFRIHPNTLRSCLAVAPAFASNAMGLEPLQFNAEEAQTVAELTRGDLLAGPAATRDRFLEAAPAYRILHLATHGKAGSRNGDYSFLAFSEPADSPGEALLYVKDLYQQQLPAELVVLSACETGVGSYLPGEGFISLGRGFAYAGARSLLTTLWSVNDARTATLMASFFEQLKKKQTKDDALHHAKRAAVQGAAHATAHPFYWAGFVVIGDTAAVRMGNRFPWWVVGLGVMVFCFYPLTRAVTNLFNPLR